ILTSTSLFNASFSNVISATSKNCDIFMLGPSSIMSPEMLQYQNIKMIFGTTFNKDDSRILNILKEGGGTRSFQKYGLKRIFK
ncbi:MAG: DUF364 domain-containing protein, partial [Bacteroidota bacterium]|nr:DUF364 domain-containing protein [Bacteroidota bacterium]